MKTDVGKKFSILKAASWYTIGNILIKGVSFFVLPIFTGLMSTYDYGVYTTYMAYLAVLENFTLCGIGATVRIAKYSDLDYDSYVTSVLVIPALLTSVLALALNLLLFQRDIVLGMGRILWNYLLLTNVITCINLILSNKLIINGQYKIFMSYSAIYTLGNIGISIFFCYTLFRNENVYMARVIGCCIASALSMIFLFYKCKMGRLRIIYVKQGISWGGPLLFHSLAAIMLAQSDQLLIQRFDSYSSAGIYGIAVTFSGIVGVVVTSLENAWAPWFYSKLSKKEYITIAKLNDAYIFAFAVIVASFMLISPEIIRFIVDKSYWDCIYSLAPLLVSVFAEMLYVLPLNVELFYKKTNKIAKMTGIAMLINVVFDIIFILNINYMAAAYVTAISRYILYMLHNFYKNKIDPNPIIHKRVVLYTSVGLIILCGCMPWLKDSIVFRGGLLGLLVATVIIYINKYKDFVKMIGQR